jgi:hypothetical protein
MEIALCYIPYGASAILHHRKSTAHFTVVSNPPNNFGKKILHRLSTVRLPLYRVYPHSEFSALYPSPSPPPVYLPSTRLPSTSPPVYHRLPSTRLPLYLSTSRLRLSLYPTVATPSLFSSTIPKMPRANYGFLDTLHSELLPAYSRM